MQKILVIDDSQDLLEMLHCVLQMSGYEVQTAVSKPEAIRKFIQFKPEIILLDVRLNQHDGRELCREIKSQAIEKPAIVFLFSASPELLKDYESCLADGVIEKPFDINTLTAKISRFLLLKNSPLTREPCEADVP